MIGKDELRNFKKMWAWLTAYPAHDREYYIRHVAKLDTVWVNECPIANSTSVYNCTGCQLLWSSSHGNLCTDPGAPLYNWHNTGRHQPDERSFYASQIAVLAMKLIRQLERRVERCTLRRKAA